MHSSERATKAWNIVIDQYKGKGGRTAVTWPIRILCSHERHDASKTPQVHCEAVLFSLAWMPTRRHPSAPPHHLWYGPDLQTLLLPIISCLALEKRSNMDVDPFEQDYLTYIDEEEDKRYMPDQWDFSTLSYDAENTTLAKAEVIGAEDIDGWAERVVEAPVLVPGIDIL
ncbi:hypothetical protein P154DRAFT_164431 [Amniculicola lignicola CBS 123094]|uniref:Uncharacterized protein n=1 Tax=Amniculicola lignicola CBS 123094 TaxID=1392246 RepID=A0A6A5WHZ7_9PLEO|nr:hypothetical protein P154DRAFT_164431 [Amniculicola lignicola CBS 123094]